MNKTILFGVASIAAVIIFAQIGLRITRHHTYTGTLVNKSWDGTDTVYISMDNGEEIEQFPITYRQPLSAKADSLSLPCLRERGRDVRHVD
jgi:hypothetical protein